MLTAMMLPTALPVLSILQRMTASRRNGGWLVALAAAGYLAAWTGFGLAAHAADVAVGAAVRRSAWLTFNGWALAAAGAGRRRALPVLRAEAALPRARATARSRR